MPWESWTFSEPCVSEGCSVRRGSDLLNDELSHSHSFEPVGQHRNPRYFRSVPDMRKIEQSRRLSFHNLPVGLRATRNTICTFRGPATSTASPVAEVQRARTSSDVMGRGHGPTQINFKNRPLRVEPPDFGTGRTRPFAHAKQATVKKSGTSGNRARFRGALLSSTRGAQSTFQRRPQRPPCWGRFFGGTGLGVRPCNFNRGNSSALRFQHAGTRTTFVSRFLNSGLLMRLADRVAKRSWPPS